MHKGGGGKLVFTKLVNETFFVRCAHLLRGPDDAQIATIDSVDEVWLERMVTARPETWEVAVPYSGNFSSLQVLADGAFTSAMVGGLVNADPDPLPPPGDDYMLYLRCTITYVAAWGSGTVPKVFRREARVAYSAATAPVS